MNLDHIREERKKSLEWKNIKPLRDKLQTLPKINDVYFSNNDVVSIQSISIKEEEKAFIDDFLLELRPWRKGPFEVFGIFIDSEWQSFIKYNLLKPHFDLKDKIVGDIGCNNGYYLFRMLKDNPSKLIGFDPSPLCKTQFDFMNFYAKTKIKYELLGVEHLPFYEHKFDILFCLGILYHRSDPILTLKALLKSLNKNGEVFLDTMMIDGDEPFCLCPSLSYAKISNIYFIPTIKALESWCLKAGFGKMEVLAISQTSINEQRKTNWIHGESLNNFLDLNNSDLTIEGYPAPKRIYVKLKLKD